MTDPFAARAGLLPSVAEAIGATPLVALDRLTRAAGVEGRVLAKLDYLNPGFSKKDRAALWVIDEATRSGALAPGQTVVELTSGNMGTGLAIVCAVRGHPFIAVMSVGNSPERARMMRALGAEVVLVAQAPGSKPGEVSGTDLDLVETAARRLTAERGAFRADQFEIAANPLSHQQGTAPEIWAQSGQTVTAFCDFVGSGGGLAGVAAYFADIRAPVRCYGVEPKGAEAMAGRPVINPAHPIQGGGYARPDLTHLKGVPLAGWLSVTGEAARDAARRLARTDGIFAGFSSGANLAAALDLLRGPVKGGAVAIVICDSGLKYLSTDLWE